MTVDLAHAIHDVAVTMNTGTPPGKPPKEPPPQLITGTVTAVSAPTCTVQFPTSSGTTTVAGLHYLLTGRTPVVNDVVLVLQTAQQRLVIAAISH